MKDLTSVSKLEFEEFLNSFDIILSDVDGVVWSVSSEITNSVNCINSLKNRGKKVRFISNNATKPYEFYIHSLHKAGIVQLQNDDLIVPTVAFIDYLKSINFNKEIYVLGTSFLKKDLANAGFKLAPEPPTTVEENIHSLMNILQPDENIGAVILDMDVNFSFIKMQKAVVYLQQKDMICLVGAGDGKLPVQRDFHLIGPHYFHSAIFDCSGRTEVIRFGKPSQEFGDYVLKKFSITDPSRVLFIGDAVREDMGFAKTCGFKKLLVLSGLTKQEDLRNWKWSKDLQPNYYIEHLGKLFELLTG